MVNGSDRQTERAKKIAASRAELARRYAEDPEGVKRFQAKMAVLADARKRERQRVDHLVLGRPRPVETVLQGKRSGRVRPKRVDMPVRLEPGIEEAVQLAERWSHKGKATAQTMEAANSTHQGALAQLHANGTIDAEQLEWAAEIANVHRSIESDVAMSVASLEARVDNSGRGRGKVIESIKRVRLHLAYGLWREDLPAPKGLVLDMIVGDSIGYTVAAKRYRVHNRKAKRLLIEAIDRWPVWVDRIYRMYSDEQIDEARQEAA